MSLSGDFPFVLIPADDAQPLEVRTASRSGGLSDDALLRVAKGYFQDRSGNRAKLDQLERLSEEERAALAVQLRAQAGNSPQAQALSDEQLIGFLRTGYESSSCEISALTVPTADNSQVAVSMYAADDSRGRGLDPNRRATELMVACGHLPPQGEDGIPPGVCGDVFVGRCRDDEAGDVWQRLDFGPDDADPRAEWCREARRPGGGGGKSGAGGAGGGGAAGAGGGASAPSLSGLMAQYAQGGSGSGVAMPAVASSGGEIFKWSQNDEEVELKFSVARGTKAKYVKVNYSKRKVKVTVAGQTLVNGETGGDIVADDCTYTLQDDPDNADGRELCVTLGKADASNWPYAIGR